MARYGSLAMEFTDSGGAHSIAGLSSSSYRHVTSAANTLFHPSGGQIANSTNVSLAPVLQDQITAVDTDAVTLTYSNTTNRYTLSTAGAVLSVTWSTAAQIRLRKLLGFSGNLSGSLSYTGTLAPYFSIEPRVVGMTGYLDVAEAADSVSKHRTAGGFVRTVGPAITSWETQWRHTNETDAQTLTAFETRFCWQRFWMDAGRYGRTCYLLDQSPPVGSSVNFAFNLATPEFDKTTHRRTRAELRDRWDVTIDAVVLGTF